MNLNHIFYFHAKKFIYNNWLRHSISETDVKFYFFRHVIPDTDKIVI